jgi:enterochelin esterase-like enzyme
MTFSEVLTYIEQITDEADYFQLGSILDYLIKRGEIEKKAAIGFRPNRGRIRIHMYKRPTVSPSEASDNGPALG